MELTIAINSYRNPELLKLCLESVIQNVQGIKYEIIVADSETQEETEIMMREEFPEVKFFAFAKNVGFQVLFKKGMSEASADYVLALNSDIIVTPQSVEKIYDFVRNRKDIGIAGPKLLNFNGTLQNSCFRFYKPVTVIYRRTFLRQFGFAKRHLDWFLMKDYDHLAPREVDWVMGSALLISKKAADDIGPMDPQFFMYMEDVDWCRRFWEKGYKVFYYPPSVMNHYHGKGSARGGFLYSIFFNRLTWVHIRSAYKYFKKYRGKKISIKQIYG